MAFSDHKIQSFRRRIAELFDEPKLPPDELKARFDACPEELREHLNSLCDALDAPTSALSLGYTRSAGVPADTVQNAIENVQQQVRNTALGLVPSGSIDNDKLSQDVRDRFAAIESAAGAEVSARVSADKAEAAARQSSDQNLQNQISTLSGGKCEMYCGSYTGNGAETRIISLPKTPKMVFVISSFGYLFLNNQNATYGGLAVNGSPAYHSQSAEALVAIVANGFQVRFGGEYQCLKSNVKDIVYNYFALL